MSRFYDALKEASRLRPATGNGEAVHRDILAGNLEEVLHVAGEAEPDTAIKPAPTPIREVESELWPDSPPRDSSVSVHATLDRRARLLPHITDSIVLEHYRRLRTKLLQENEARPFRLVMVGSPNPQEGKTVTALNLALSFAMLPSYKVLVVDGDMRKGSLGKWLAVSGPPGLSDLLAGTANLNEVVLKSEELPIHFVLRGNSESSPAELFNSPNLKDRFRQMADQFDLVIVDSPPLNLVTDAQLLAGCCDGLLLVARAFSTTRKAFEKMVQDLQQFRILGTILNGGTPVSKYRKYHSYY